MVSGVWTDQWIFWVGPFTGAILAAITYELFFRPSGPIVSNYLHHLRRAADVVAVTVCTANFCLCTSSMLLC